MYILDTRNGYYFGGGKADSLFVFFTEDIKTAKKFKDQGSVQKVINALKSRTEKYGVEAIQNNPCMKFAPPYQDDVYTLVQ